jgi:predicted DNA-binding protein
MPEKTLTERRKIGRPPAGARAGEKVKDYPQLSVRLPADIRTKLQALSVITAQPQWRLIIEAIECFLRDLPPAEKAKVQAMVARLNGGGGKHRRSERS